MKSPCIGICSTGLGDDVCRGCGRTLEEIRTWALLTDEERESIMASLEARGPVSPGKETP